MKNRKMWIIGGVILIVCVLSYFGINHKYLASDNKNKIDIDTNTNLYEENENDLKTREYLDQKEINKEGVSKRNSYINNSDNKFNLDEAIELCKKKYGSEQDTVYIGNNKIENINGKSGYMIQIKSRQLMKQGGTGILFTVFVSSSKEIVEL